MRNIIQFNITKEGKWYTAEGIGIPVVTQAKTLQELNKNIREVVGLYLEDEDPKETGITPSPSVLVQYELANV
ncbi:MAG: type II toxin-antitoxin system HicB family antitoxin [Patescibacteria group bacterium]